MSQKVFTQSCKTKTGYLIRFSATHFFQTRLDFSRNNLIEFDLDFSRNNLISMAANGDVDWAGAADAQEKSLVNKVGELNVGNAGGRLNNIYSALMPDLQPFYIQFSAEFERQINAGCFLNILRKSA